MLKYFSFHGETVCGVYYSEKGKTVSEINEFANNNNLKITQICASDEYGLFVVFEELN